MRDQRYSALTGNRAYPSLMLQRKAFWWSFVVLGLCGAAVCVHYRSTAKLFEVGPFEPFYADGRESDILLLEATHLQTVQPDEVQAIAGAAPVGISKRYSNSPLTFTQRVPVLPGTEQVHVLWRGRRLTFPVKLLPDVKASSAAPSLPDWMPLHTPEDRAAFRRWFTQLADRVADAPPQDLPPEISDCAALLRYSYRESLRLHDDRWYAQAPALERINTPSVAQWSYPNTPLGTGLFRTRPGTFAPADIADGTFAQFADAKNLSTANSFLVGRDLRQARPGDLLFYRVLELDSQHDSQYHSSQYHSSQYHSMIVTGEHAEWVVYHTGPAGAPGNGQPSKQTKGEMRRVLLRDLLHHPDPRWRPTPANANFLGVFRWNILAEDK